MIRQTPELPAGLWKKNSTTKVMTSITAKPTINQETTGAVPTSTNMLSTVRMPIPTPYCMPTIRTAINIAITTALSLSARFHTDSLSALVVWVPKQPVDFVASLTDLPPSSLSRERAGETPLARFRLHFNRKPDLIRFIEPTWRKHLPLWIYSAVA